MSVPEGPNLFRTTLLLLASAILLYVIGSVFDTVFTKGNRTLATLWSRDIDQLKSTGGLPKFWDDIRTVEKIVGEGDKMAKSWSTDVSVPLEVNPSGNYKLEILYVSDSENKHLKAMIRHHILKIDSGNSVWELSRTYDLK